jgi:hypothetical protein
MNISIVYKPNAAKPGKREATVTVHGSDREAYEHARRQVILDNPRAEILSTRRVDDPVELTSEQRYEKRKGEKAKRDADRARWARLS